MASQEMLIVKKSYDFSKWLLNHTGKFPKSYRFSVAVRLENTMLEFTDTLALVGRLLADPESLLHKATGWMLREVGKRDQPVLEAFLARHAPAMPRTALRYAIERLPEEQRKQYLKKS